MLIEGKLPMVNRLSLPVGKVLRYGLRFARTRGKIVSLNGGKPGPMAGLFTFCTPEFQQSIGRGTQATKGPTNSSARSNEKKKKPRRGGRGFFGSFGGNKVTGGKPSLVLA